MKEYLPFDKNLYAKVLAAVAFAIMATFTVAILFFNYKLTNADIPGSLVAIPIAAYLVHLWIMPEEDPQN